MGILTQVFFDYSGERTKLWFRRFPYTRSMGLAALLFGGGGVMAALLTLSYVRHHFQLPEHSVINNLGIIGLLFMIVGFMVFTFTLLLHSTSVARRR